MPKPLSHPSVQRSYERHHQRWTKRRHQLLLGIWLTCSGFSWPGRVPHLSYRATHGTARERVEALRWLQEYPSEASRDACLAALEDGSSEVRSQAADCVGWAGDQRAISNLLDLAGADSPTERAAALQALGQLAPERALVTIERALEDPAPAVRSSAVHALTGYVGGGSVELAKLAPLLTSEQVEVRLSAVELLADARAFEPTRALPLSAAARDPAAEVRARALRGLGARRDPAHLPELSAGLADPDERVRLSAIAALGDSNLAGAAPLLRAITAAAGAQDTQLRAARTAVAALGRIDAPAALPPLASALAAPLLTRSAAQALVARVRRVSQPDNVTASAAAVQQAIVSMQTLPLPGHGHGHADEPSSAAWDALAWAVLELAPYGDVRGATLALWQALERGRGNALSLTRTLIALASASPPAVEGGAASFGARLLSALLQRDAAASPSLQAAVVAALEASADAQALLNEHAEALQRLTAARPARTPEALKLQALLQIALADDSLDARRALSQLWAAQPALASGRAQQDRLVRWLDDGDPEVREQSSLALGRAGDTQTLEALSARLERDAPYPELTLRACAGTLLRASEGRHTLPHVLREHLLQQLQAQLRHDDESVAMSAVFALRAARDQRAAPWIASLLRGRSLQLRAAAIQALAGFDQPEARRLLRDLLRGDNPHNASNAALALAERGSDRDVEALLRAAERGSWPLPPAAAYAAARITARGATRKHSLERVLCRFAQLPDSYARSNIVSALAHLGAAPCDEQINPTRLLDPALPSMLRVSAALWLKSTRPHAPEPSNARDALLAQCAGDHDPAVAAACRPGAEPTESVGHTLVHTLPERVVALQHPDGTVFVGSSDSTGMLLLPRATSGALSMTDPANDEPVRSTQPTGR